jgi:hypothetical protein
MVQTYDGVVTNELQIGKQDRLFRQAQYRLLMESGIKTGFYSRMDLRLKGLMT